MRKTCIVSIKGSYTMHVQMSEEYVSVSACTSWVQMVFCAIVKALIKFLTSISAAKWWFPWHLLLLSCMTTQVWRAPAEHVVKLLNKNFHWTYAPYVAACEFLGWRGSSWEYLCISFLICIPLIVVAWNCSVISSVISVNPEIIPGKAWSEMHKNRPLKGIATLKKNKGPEVETEHGLETWDSLESWVFSLINSLEDNIKIKLCTCQTQVSVFCNALF